MATDVERYECTKYAKVGGEVWPRIAESLVVGVPPQHVGRDNSLARPQYASAAAAACASKYGKIGGGRTIIGASAVLCVMNKQIAGCSY